MKGTGKRSNRARFHFFCCDQIEHALFYFSDQIEYALIRSSNCGFGRRSGGCCDSRERAKPNAKSDEKRRFRRGLDAGPEAVATPESVQNTMQKATKSDDFGAVWTQVRRLLRLPRACKTRSKKTTKATISARSGRRSAGCFASRERAKPDAKSDDFRDFIKFALSPQGCVPRGRVAYPPGQGKALRLIKTVSASALP